MTTSDLQETPDATRAPLLDWMVGEWTRTDGAGSQGEVWLSVHTDLLVATAYREEGGERTPTEHLYILRVGESVELVASPEGQGVARFPLVEADGRRAVFENPRHDFPRRIVYERADDESGPRLKARIEGEGAPPREWAWRGAEPGTPTLPIVLSATVAASPAEVYRAFTTRNSVRTFFAPDALVEPTVGGAYEMYFMPDAPEGQRGGEGCRFVELVPDERVAFTWNFPPPLPAIRRAHCLVTVELTRVAPQQTSVTIHHVGFRPGPVWVEGRAYFERAWNIVLDRLKKRFLDGPVDWSSE